MQQPHTPSRSQRIKDYHASKTVLFWACAGSAVLAIVVGFAWGGWVTGGSAREMAANSAAQARQKLAAVVCVNRFLAAPDAGVQLTALKEITSSYAQEKFLQDGGWTMIVPASSSTADRKPSAATRSDERKTAGLCAEELAKLEASAAEAALNEGTAPAAQ